MTVSIIDSVSVDQEIVEEELPVFAAMVNKFFDPFLDVVPYENEVGELLDAMNRSVPDPWWPKDLHSVASMIAGRLGTTYTDYSREHADALAWRLANGGFGGDPTTVKEWMARYGHILNEPTSTTLALESSPEIPAAITASLALTAPTLLGLGEEEELAS